MFKKKIVWYVICTLENFTISDGSLDSFVFLDFFLYESLQNTSTCQCIYYNFSQFTYATVRTWARDSPWCNQQTRFFSGPLWNISWQTPPCCIGCPARFSHRCPYQRCLCRPLHTHWQETPPRGEMRWHNSFQRDVSVTHESEFQTTSLWSTYTSMDRSSSWAAAADPTATATAAEAATRPCLFLGSSFLSTGMLMKSGAATGWTNSTGKTPDRPWMAPNFQPLHKTRN